MRRGFVRHLRRFFSGNSLRSLFGSFAAKTAELAKNTFPKFGQSIEKALDTTLQVLTPDSAPFTSNPTFGWMPSEIAVPPRHASRETMEKLFAVNRKMYAGNLDPYRLQSPAMDPWSAYMSSSRFKDHPSSERDEILKLAKGREISSYERKLEEFPLNPNLMAMEPVELTRKKPRKIRQKKDVEPIPTLASIKKASKKKMTEAQLQARLENLERARMARAEKAKKKTAVKREVEILV